MPSNPPVFRAAFLSLALLFVAAALGCAGEGEGARPPRDGAAPDGAPPRAPGGGRSEEPEEAGRPIPRDGAAPMVVDPGDTASLRFPLVLVDVYGVVRTADDLDEMRAILDAEEGAVQSEEVHRVRLFYATDRNREEPGAATVLRPLVPAALALLAAFLVARLLARWLREEARWVAYVSGGAVFLAAGGLLFRGTVLALETLRLARHTDVLYGSERSASGGLELGVAVVSIPVQRHEIARIESPSLLRGELFPDPLRHFVIERVEPLAEQRFYDSLERAVARSPRREACVFVHGYNNTFAYAAMRLAQIVYDVGFEGAPILYSWPSKGAAALYTYDRENADWSTGNLSVFLSDLKERSGARRVHLIAHSMGSRVAANAVVQAVPDADELGEPYFNEIILAAPDIDASTFERFIAPELTGRADRVTLYASERDDALLASVQVNGHRRAGMAGEGLVIVEGMDTVDVSRVAGGHAYIADSNRVLGDLVELVRSALPAAERSSLEERERGDARYWEIVDE